MKILRTQEHCSKKNMNWIYNSFPFPEILLGYSNNVQELIAHFSISSPIELLSRLAHSEGIALKSPDKLYTQVFSNTEIDTIEKVSIVFDLLRVGISENEVIDNMIQYLYRYLYDSTFQLFVERGLVLERKLTLWFPSERIEKEIDLLVEMESINYIDPVDLPEHCCIIDNNIELIRVSQELDHSAHEHWPDAMSRNSFFIAMKLPEEATFEISRDYYMNDFRIVEAATYGNIEPRRDAIDIIINWLSQVDVQEFLKKNILNRNNTNKYNQVW